MIMKHGLPTKTADNTHAQLPSEFAEVAAVLTGMSRNLPGLATDALTRSCFALRSKLLSLDERATQVEEMKAVIYELISCCQYSEAEAEIKKAGSLGEFAYLILLKDSNARVQHTAISLASFGQVKIPAAFPVYLSLLDDADVETARTAMDALQLYREKHKLVVPVLIEKLRDGSVGGHAALTLGCFRTKAAPAAPALKDMLRARNRHWRYFAATALAKIGAADEKAVRVLMRAIKRPDDGYLPPAAAALGMLGKRAKAIVPELKQMATKLEQKDRTLAVYILAAVKGIETDMAKK